jgi:hypothetical protein
MSGLTNLNSIDSDQQDASDIWNQAWADDDQVRV